MRLQHTLTRRAQQQHQHRTRRRTRETHTQTIDRVGEREMHHHVPTLDAACMQALPEILDTRMVTMDGAVKLCFLSSRLVSLPEFNSDVSHAHAHQWCV